MTLTVPEDLDLLLDDMKKNLFYDCSRSEMIRTLIMEGLESMNAARKRKGCATDKRR